MEFEVILGLFNMLKCGKYFNIVLFMKHHNVKKINLSGVK